MVAWLLIYVAGLVPAIATISLIAFMRRDSHEMSRTAVAQLTVSAGLVWPLLAVAVVQVAGLLVLKSALVLVRGRDEEVDVAADAPSVQMLQPVVAAAAA